MSNELFSDIRIFPLKNSTGNLKANGKVVIAKTVEVSFKIMNGKNGIFISLPAQKVEKDGIEAIRHKTYLIYGVQFHPEMFVDKTCGDEIFHNFLRLAAPYRTTAGR